MSGLPEKSRTDPVRLGIADDDELFRSALRVLLGIAPGITIVAEVGDGNEAVQLASEIELDVLLMDVQMRGLNGIDATCRIKSIDAHPAVVIMTAFDHPEWRRDAQVCGANGYLLKRTPMADLVRAVRVAAGGAILW